MNVKKLVAALALVSFTAAPAFAATEWFIVKNEKTKKCEVTDKKPDMKNKGMMQIGMTWFKTKEDAEKALKTAIDCGAK